MVESELVPAVDEAFVRTGRGLRPWPDPHPDRLPRDEEYSRLLDPAKWRIIGARADAWLVAIVETGLAMSSTTWPSSGWQRRGHRSLGRTALSR